MRKDMTGDGKTHTVTGATGSSPSPDTRREGTPSGNS